MTNEWGDELAEAERIELSPGQALPVNEWGDQRAPDVVVRVPAADTPSAALIAAPPRPQSATAGGTTGLGAGLLRQDLPGLREIYGTIADPVAEALDLAPIPVSPDDIVEGALRAAPPVGAAVLAAPLSPLGQAGAFGLGMGVGDTLAQGYRILRGQQEGFELAPTVTSTALGMGGAAIAPFMPIAQPAAPTARAFVQSLARPLAAEAVTAAGISGAAQLATTGQIDAEQTAWDTLLGAGAGLAFNAAMAGQASAAMREGLYNRARSMGWRGDSWTDLRDWVRSETARRVPPADATPPGAAPAPAAARVEAAPAATPTPAPSPAPTPAGRVMRGPAMTRDQWRVLSRTERVGRLATLSDQQLAELAGQIGARPPANAWGDTPAAPALPPGEAAPTAPDAPTAQSFDELASLWREVGVDLAFTRLPGGEIELTSIRVPEGQQGQGIGSVVLQEVKDLADVLRQPVQIGTARPAGMDPARLDAWFEAAGFARAGNRKALRYVPETTKPGVAVTGRRPTFGKREDGVHDLLDDIAQIGGVPRPPADNRGGEWNGWGETFGSSAARLLVNRNRGAIDKAIDELNTDYGYNFDSPDDFYSAVTVAMEERRRAKLRVKQEQNQAKFYDAALENKGRPKAKAGDPIATNDLATGDRFRALGDDFVVQEITEDGRVIAKDGPDVGTVELPPDAVLYPDKGSYKPGNTAAQVVNEWGDLAAENSPTPQAPETPQFKRWFSGSKVVDSQGKPLVVYHGTNADISVFDPAFRGQNTGAPSAREGFFFTDSAEVASGYATDAGGGQGDNVIPVLLSIKNPLVYDFGGSEYRDKSYAGLIAQAKSEGRDGAIFLNTDDSMVKGPKIGTTEPEKLRMEAHGKYAELFDKNGKLVFSAELLPNDFWLLERRESGSRELVRSSQLETLAEQAQEWYERAFTREPIYAPVSPHAVYVAFEPSQIQFAIGNKGSYEPGDPRASAGASAGAAASPGSQSAEAYPGAQDRPPEPSDDPTFSHLPIELPELVQFYRAISGGQYPRIREKLRVLKGEALGVFYHRDGPDGVGKIELKADIFRLVSEAQRRQLLADAITWARMTQANGGQGTLEDLTAAKFNELVKAAEQQALTENPRQALAVLAHEIGHWIDWLPDKTLKRGNLLGHIMAFRSHFKSFAAKRPGMDPAPEAPTRNQVEKLRRQAERELRKQVAEVVEVIRREEPIYREFPITADNITSILKNAQRDEFPGLYDWFAGLDRADKAAVLRAAMKGAVDPRAAQFSRREATGETRTVEETVTRKVGKEPTREEIQARFEELLRAELRARGLISEKQIRAEADAVLKWWQGVPEVPAYFKTATETYAELFSAIINNPAGVAKRAPTLWAAFNAYMENRPDFARTYREMQDAIRSGAIHRERVMNLREMWHRDEDNSLLADSMFQAMDGAALRDTLSLLFNRQTGPLQRRALEVLRKNKQDRYAAQALSGLKNYLYRATGWEAMARDINLHVEAPLAQAGLHHDDMSEFLFHSRIAAGDRQQLANPLGWSPKTSSERLAEMEAQLGPQRWQALQEAAATFRAIYEEQVLPLLRESRMLTPELLKIIEDRTLYATFAKAREFNPLEAGTLQGALENRYGKDVTARIYRQIGTLGEIRSPYLATVQKAFSLISTARRQIGIKSVVRFLEEHEPGSIIPAEERFVSDGQGGRWEPVPMETRQVGTLYTLEEGKAKAYYVPRPIAEMFSHGSPLESQIVGLAHKALAWPKAILTELNPAFWPVAFVKDVVNASVQIPGGGLRIARNLPSSWTAARASMLSRPSLLADDALRRLMVISRADNRGEHLGHADELTRVLMRMGQNPQLWDAEAKKIGAFLRFWMAWKRQGQVLERTIKIASMQTLDQAFPDMPEWEKKRIVNEQGGSPDFLEKGRAAPLVDFWMMFYNPWLRGLEAAKTSAQRDPRGFWTKFLGTIGLAGAAFWMFEQGLLGEGAGAEETRDMLRSIPERDKRRGFTIPLGWADKEQGKVAYLVLPFPDTLRMIYVGQRGSLQAMSGDQPLTQGLGEIISYQGQDIPGMNPMLEEAGKWYDYHVLGRNPYDDFLGRGVLDDDQVTARQGGTELALQSLSNVTGGIVYRHQPQRPGQTPTDLEKFLRSPVVGNMLGRWIRVSSRGLDEETDRDVAQVRQREAELRLVADEIIAREMKGEPWSDSQTKLYMEEPYLAQRVLDRQLTLMKQATSAEMRAWERAKSVGERTALLEAWARRDEQRKARLNQATN